MNSKTDNKQHLEVDAKDIKERIKLELGYDSDLVKDSDDEERLGKMTDLNREREIFDRKQQRDQLLQRYELIKKKHQLMQKTQNRVLNQSMLSDDSSSSSDSSSQDSSSSSQNNSPVSASAKRPFLNSSNDKVEIVKPSLLGKHPSECTLNNYKSMQLTREQIVQNISQPFVEELLCGSYVRIVSGVQQYVMARVISMSKGVLLYKVQSGGTKNQTSQTKVLLLVQHGRTQKQVKIDVLSNQDLTLDEFLVYKSACEKFKVLLPLKQQAAKRSAEMQKLLKGQWDKDALEQYAAKRFEKNVKSGNFNQIASIPYEISRLNAELAEIRKKQQQGVKTGNFSFDSKYQLHQVLEDKAKKIQWLIDQLNKHREGATDTAQMADEDIEMKSDGESEYIYNSDYAKLCNELEQMQQVWQEGRKRFQVDAENDQSVSELYMQLKDTYLESHYGVEMVEIDSSLLNQKPVEFKSAFSTNQHIRDRLAREPSELNSNVISFDSYFHLQK